MTMYVFLPPVLSGPSQRGRCSLECYSRCMQSGTVSRIFFVTFFHEKQHSVRPTLRHFDNINSNSHVQVLFYKSNELIRSLYNARQPQAYWNPQIFENSILFATIIAWASIYHFWKCCDIMSLWCCLNCELCQTVEFISCDRKLENSINDEGMCSNENNAIIGLVCDQLEVSLCFVYVHLQLYFNCFFLPTRHFPASHSLPSWLTTACPLHALLTSLCFLYPLDLLYPFSLPYSKKTGRK